MAQKPWRRSSTMRAGELAGVDLVELAGVDDLVEFVAGGRRRLPKTADAGAVDELAGVDLVVAGAMWAQLLQSFSPAPRVVRFQLSGSSSRPHTVRVK